MKPSIARRACGDNVFDARLLGFGVLAVTLAICHPVVRVAFFGDDFQLFVRLVDQHLVRFLFAPFNGHVMPVPNFATFAIFEAVGFTPLPYFSLVLGLHLLNAWLLHRLLVRSTGRPVLAALGATVWATGPTAIEALAWYIDLGTVILSTCTLGFLLAVIRSAAAAAVVTPRAAVGWTLLLLLGANSFASGVAVAVVMPIMLTYRSGVGLRCTRSARAILLLTAVLAVTIFVVLSAVWDQPTYSELSLSAALRSIVMRWRLALDLWWRLVRAGLSRAVAGWALPESTAALNIVAATAVAALLAGVRAGTRVERRIVVLPLVVVVAMYAAVAAGRAPHMLWSLPWRSFDQSASAARYHYLSTALVLVVALRSCGWLEGHRRGAGGAAMAVWGLLQVGAWAVYAVPPNPQTESAMAVAEVRRELDAHLSRAPTDFDVYVGNVPLPKSVVGVMGRSEVPGWAAVYALTYPYDDSVGRRVFFVEPEYSVRSQFPAVVSQRLAALLIPPWADSGAPRECAVSHARAIALLLRDALRCPPIAGGIDPACAERADRRYARALRALTALLPTCARDAKLLADVHTRVQLANVALSCNASGVPSAEAMPCVRRRRRWLISLVRMLAACHVAAIEGSDDRSCKHRALDRWQHRAQAGGEGCPSCLADADLGRIVDENLAFLLDRAVPMPVARGRAIYLRSDEEVRRKHTEAF